MTVRIVKPTQHKDKYLLCSDTNLQKMRKSKFSKNQIKQKNTGKHFMNAF